MIRNLALWAASLAAALLLLILREERLAAQGKVPIGRLRRLWFGAERRRKPRYRVDWSVKYQRSENQPSAGAQTRDLSQTGAGLTLDEKLPPGCMLDLELPVPGRQVPLRVTALVVWSKEIADSRSADPQRHFFVGVHFQNLSATLREELAVLLKNPGYTRQPDWPPRGSAASGDRATRYAALKRGLWLADLGFTLMIFCLLIFGGAASQWSGWVAARFPSWPMRVAVYSGGLWLAYALLTFPLDWLRGFRIEHRFQLSTQSFADWLKDHAKQLALGAAMGLGMVEALSLLLRASPRGWWFWAAVAWTAWSILLTRVAPTLLIPIFYKQEPLKESPLRKRLESLLAKCGTRVNGLFSVNLSRTTQKANACLCGMGGSRRVLVSDTLLSHYPDEEVETVLAHELGHHRLHHIGILLGMSAAASAVSCFLVDRLALAWMPRLGISGLTDLSALPLVGFGLFVAGLTGMPLFNGISRALEKQADLFALEQTGDPAAFVGTLRRLAEQNLAEANPPRWVEWLLYDHPPISKRIALGEEYGKRHG